MLDPLEFGLPLVINNRLSAERAASGEALKCSEIVELLAASQSLFDLATLCARDMTRTRDCRELWCSMRDLYNELDRAWGGVTQDEELTAAYRAQLQRLGERCTDNANMYVISSRERRIHSSNREDANESFGVRNAITPDGYRDESSPMPVYQLGHF